MAAPKLRFKEFDKAFSRNTIKELAKIYVGRDLVEDAYSPIKTETHIYPIYSNSVDNEGLYGYYNFEEFNFDDDALTVVGRGAGLGKAFYRQGGFGTIGRLLSLTPKDKSFHPKYLSDYINDKLIIHNESGGIPQLPRSSLENYEVVLPSYEEQTKIASFLSNVDEKISQLTQKHELLSQYKQGMMQKLFSQQIRFKADDGSEFGEWEEKTLGSLGVFKSGQGFPEKYQGGKTGVPFFKVSDMNTYGNEKRMVVANNYVDADSILEMKVKVILDESIIFAKVGAAVFLERKRLATNFLIDNNMMAFIPDPKLNINFIKQFLDTIKFSNFVQVGALPSYNAGDLAIIPIHIPCVVEQTKIANFLSAIDQKIDVVAQQIEQAKQWKKGLLQQMFV